MLPVYQTIKKNVHKNPHYSLLDRGYSCRIRRKEEYMGRMTTPSAWCMLAGIVCCVFLFSWPVLAANTDETAHSEIEKEGAASESDASKHIFSVNIGCPGVCARPFGFDFQGKVSYHYALSPHFALGGRFTGLATFMSVDQSFGGSFLPAVSASFRAYFIPKRFYVQAEAGYLFLTDQVTEGPAQEGIFGSLDIGGTIPLSKHVLLYGEIGATTILRYIDLPVFPEWQVGVEIQF